MIPIAKLVIKESFRKKIYHFLIIFSLLILFVLYSYSPFGVKQQTKTALDFSLSILPLLGLFVTLFTCTTLITEDINSKRIYLILSKPISRFSYLCGKLLGAYLSIFLVYFIIGLIIFGFVYFSGMKQFFSLTKIFWAIFFSFFEMMLMANFIVCLAFFLPQGTAISLSIFGYLFFHIKSNFLKYALLSNPDSVKTFIWKIFYYIIPDFEYFNLRDQAVHNFVLKNSQIYMPLLYGTATLFLFLTIASIFLYRKEL